MFRKGNQKGFTLIEVIVVAGIIAILAGILVPMIMNQVDDAKVARAQGDMKSIQSSIMNFKKDTSSWPDKTGPGVAGVTMLYTDSTSGAPPSTTGATNWDSSNAQRLLSHLKADDNAAYGASWKGPYMTTADADPWGNAYIINAADFSAASNVPVWIISAGPDGIVATGAHTNTCADKNNGGDDICLRIK